MRKARGARKIARVYQVVHSDEHLGRTDPAFVPYDARRGADAHYREMALFVRLYHAGLHRAAPYVGLVSPKFGRKTGKAGAQFLEFIAANPGHDVYFINPYPQHAYFFWNVWTHAEACHPGLTRLAQDLFDAAGVDFELESMSRNAPATAAYCNYWAGNEKFWDRYMDVALKLLTALESMPQTGRQRYLAIDPDYPDPVPLITFIFERLLSTLLVMDDGIRAMAWPCGHSELLVAAESSPEQFKIVCAFQRAVAQIDSRQSYGNLDRAVFAALAHLVSDSVVPRRHAAIRY
jgi:hypothetical protein